jgi:GR25 family glycosyltransferase involved in LPS biosynthesis
MVDIADPIAHAASPRNANVMTTSLLDLVPVANRFVINLDRRPDRRSHYEQQFARARIAPIRVAAVDGTSLPRDHARGISPTSGRRCTLAEVACSQSHIALWRMGATRNEPLMVFEDDVFFGNDIGDRLRSTLILPSDYGIFYLGAAWREDVRSFDRPGIYELRGCRTTHAYVISPGACDRLLELAETMPNVAADHYTLLAHRRQLVRAHIHLPFWAVQTNDSSDIGIRLSLARSFGTLFEGVLPDAARRAAV